jgi:hypothetical protein
VFFALKIAVGFCSTQNLPLIAGLSSALDFVELHWRKSNAGAPAETKSAVPAGGKQ